MKTARIDVVSYHDLLASLGPEARAQLEAEEARSRHDRNWTLRNAYTWEVSELVRHAMSCELPEVVMLPFEKYGSQHVANFWVNDLRKPQTDAINFHGQNTSQWVYAGCILVQDGRVSTHH